MEDDTDAVSPIKGQPSVIHLGDVLTVDHHLALIWRIQPSNDVDQGRLPATTFACNG